MGWWKKHVLFPLIYICILVTLWTASRKRGWSSKHECNLSTLCYAWAWWTQVLRESKTILEVQRPAGYMLAAGVCCCWLSYGEEGCMFFVFRVAYHAVGEKETTLEESTRQFKLADPFLYNFWNPGVVERQWSYVFHTTWETFIQFLQQFPDTVTAAEEWIRQMVKVGRCSYTATLKPFLEMWESSLRVYLQQLQQKVMNVCVQCSWRTVDSLSKWSTCILRSVRGQPLCCGLLKVCSFYPGTSSRPSPDSLPAPQAGPFLGTSGNFCKASPSVQHRPELTLSSLWGKTKL